MDRCSVCGAVLHYGSARVRRGGIHWTCGPEGSPCHAMGARSDRWTLTERQATVLLADDVDALRRDGVRSVDPLHPNTRFGERAQHVAA